jgi:hypothetical protein
LPIRFASPDIDSAPPTQRLKYFLKFQTKSESISGTTPQAINASQSGLGNATVPALGLFSATQQSSLL